MKAAALVDPEDVCSMALEMVELATNAQKRAKLRSAGFKQAARFEWGRTAREMLRVFEGGAAPAPATSMALAG